MMSYKEGMFMEVELDYPLVLTLLSQHPKIGLRTFCLPLLWILNLISPSDLKCLMDLLRGPIA